MVESRYYDATDDFMVVIQPYQKDVGPPLDVSIVLKRGRHNSHISK
jgi:hypothetical protein